jgi:hypothetical protein
MLDELHSLSDTELSARWEHVRSCKVHPDVYAAVMIEQRRRDYFAGMTTAELLDDLLEDASCNTLEDHIASGKAALLRRLEGHSSWEIKLVEGKIQLVFQGGKLAVTVTFDEAVHAAELANGLGHAAATAPFGKRTICKFCPRPAVEVVDDGPDVVYVCRSCREALEYGNEMNFLNVAPLKDQDDA